jgi:hypothetical protein
MDKHKQGKRNRAAGKRFELKVRADLESKGWIVFRNSNDVTKPVETEIGEYERFFKQTTGHWNPGTHSIMMSQSGFPDFICIKGKGYFNEKILFEIQFVECKGGDEKHKYLSAEEKEKVEWIKDKLKIPVVVANKGDKRGEITYD